jgi:uncharacterized protein (UPF0303 family)
MTQALVDAIRRQEQMLVLPAFDEIAAWEVGEALRAAGLARRAPIIVDIRTAARRLYFAALPGSAPDNEEWARRKSNLVLRCHASSLRFAVELELKGRAAWPDFGLHPRDYVAAGGGFPVTVPGVGVIGCIAVSGLPSREDHELITAVLAKRLGLEGMALPSS